MEQKKDIYTLSLDRLKQHIISRGLRQTQEREMVLKTICQMPMPFTASSLVDAMKEQHISRATVFNTLQLLISAHILQSIQRQIGRMETQYELILNNGIHMQIVCERCGRVATIRNIAINNLIAASKYNNFIPYRHSLYVYGQCKKCRKLIS